MKEVSCVTRESVNHLIEISKIHAICQLMKDLKDMFPMTHVHELFRIYCKMLFSGFGASRFLLFRLVRISKARSSKVIVRYFFFKTQATPEL
jgi:hypothetical protein